MKQCRKEYLKDYKLRNKEILKTKRNIYEKLKRKNNPLFRLSNNIKRLISMNMKRKGYKKNSKTQLTLGCTNNEFKLHLESQFEPWMSWDNYGLYNGEFNYGWDIDHIVPCATALNENELLKLNHYTNLQPLCSKINRDIKRDNVVTINKIDNVSKISIK